jgi:TolB-like protein/DNA-binding winged helix-turn-helix (wHTH) protein/Tfp pilus assembly protein PilF
MPDRVTKYRFGSFEVQPRTRELYNQGIRLKLRFQAFQVLQVLIEHAGDVVTRDELRQMLWPAGTFVDFEHGLNTSVKELRRVLGDSANEPRYIETLPKVGYRWLASVVREEPVSLVTAEPPPQIATAEPDIPAMVLAEANQLPHSRGSLVLYGAVLLLVAALAGYWQWRHVNVRVQPTDGRVMLAVLPFQNLTGDSSQEYFSDGLTEEMIAQLGRLDPAHFGVIARTSVMHYKNSRDGLDRIGRELGVQYVLEGSVRRDSYNVRVSAQLIRVRDQGHAWAREYDRQSGSLLTLQDEIAREIADEIALTLGDHKPNVSGTRPALSPQQSEAYDFYLKGLYFWNKRTIDGFWQAINYYKDAIARDPNHAPSYAGMADCYAMIGGYSGESHPEYAIQARAAALRALAIDETLPEAHAALAVIVQHYDWDWQTAEKEYRRAIELNSSYATGHHWYAEHLGLTGRFDEAFRESDRARQLDPLSLIIATDSAVLYYYSRQYDRSIQQFRAVMELDLNFPRANMILFPYVQKRMFAEALARLEATRPASEAGPWLWSQLAYIYGRSGQPEEAGRALAKLNDLSRRHPVDPSAFVIAYLGIGDKNEALAWLQKAYEQHSDTLTTLRVDPIFDPLRGESRFQDFVRRVGL